MSKKSPVRIDKKKRPEKPNHSLDQEKMTHFGYRAVPEEEKVEWVKRHFNTVASKYDVMNTLLSFGIHYLWKRSAVKLLHLAPGDRVLDLCGGTGDLSFMAAKGLGPAGHVVLYDINRAMIEKGRHKAANSSYGKKVFYIQGDVERIAFPDELFDAAMVGFGIRNLTHLEQGFIEIYRVLRPGGKLMCLEFSKPTAPLFRWLYDLYSFTIMPLLGWLIVGSRQAYSYLPESIRLFPLPDELTTILRRIGFSSVSYKKLTNGIAVIHLAIKS